VKASKVAAAAKGKAAEDVDAEKGKATKQRVNVTATKRTNNTDIRFHLFFEYIFFSLRDIKHFS
jgi:hypothetical protein